LQDKPSFSNIVDDLLEKTTQLIQAIEEGIIDEDNRGDSDVTNLYTILGHVVSSQQINEAKRLSVLEWAINRLLSAL